MKFISAATAFAILNAAMAAPQFQFHKGVALPEPSSSGTREGPLVMENAAPSAKARRQFGFPEESGSATPTFHGREGEGFEGGFPGAVPSGMARRQFNFPSDFRFPQESGSATPTFPNFGSFEGGFPGAAPSVMARRQLPEPSVTPPTLIVKERSSSSASIAATPTPTSSRMERLVAKALGA